jgi:hypothetical protein
MNFDRLHPDTLFSQLGYVRRSNVGVDIAKAAGFIAVGALAGAAAMALFAPRTGTQLRAELRSGADHLKDRVAKGGSDFKNALHDGVSAL